MYTLPLYVGSSSPSLTQSWAGIEGWHPTSSVICKPSVGSQGAVWQQDGCCQAGQAVCSAVDGLIEKATEQSGGMKSEGAVVHPTAPNGLCASPVTDAGASSGVQPLSAEQLEQHWQCQGVVRVLLAPAPWQG